MIFSNNSFFKVAITLLICAMSIHLCIAQPIEPSHLKNANAVILTESNDVELISSDKYKQTYYRKIKILNKKAGSLSSIYMHYKQGSDKLKDIKITIYDGSGKKLKSIKSKELDDYASGDGYSMISDYRVKHWKYNSNNYPFIIEYSFIKESETTLSLPTWNPIPDYNVAVLQSQYTYQGSSEVRTKKLNLENFESIKNIGSTYKMENQNALNKEKYSPSSFDIFPAIIFNPSQYSFEGIKGSFDTWKGYGAWIYNSFLKNKELKNTDQIKQELDGIIVADDSQIKVAQKIYSYIQDNTRYISIALDEGGLNPMDPNKVHEVKYGDCKALSLYMHSLLKLYDINSNYVEVHADSDHPISLYEDFPSSFPGNHIILQLLLDKDTAWVDCTSSKNPFGYLGEFTDDRTVLCVSKEGGSLTRTPTLSASQNLDEEITNIHLDDKGNASIDVSHISHGYTISRDIRLKDLSDKDQKDYFKENLYDNLNVTKCSAIEIDIDHTVPNSKVDYNLEILMYTEQAGDYQFIGNEISPLTIPKLPKDGRRESNIKFPRSYSEQSVINITTDSAYELVLVEPIIYESEYGKYNKSVIKSNDAIVVTRSFQLNKGDYDKSEYKKIKSFFDKCIKSDKEQTTIKRL